MPIIQPRWREERRPPIGALKPENVPYIRNTGGAYQMPYAALPTMVDSRVPWQADTRTALIMGGTAEPQPIAYYVSNRTERAGRVYSPRPTTLSGGSFNGDTLYIGTRDTGDVYGG